jgi:hypothetical protein
MSFTQLHAPVLFLVFNRLDMAKRVFEEIRKAQPLKLFIAADSPRVDRDGEAGNCEAVRQFIMDNIDWKCEVKTLFRDENLGCRDAVSSAIDWFFDNVEEGIILEDDCLPHQDFFRFCEEMLEYYRDNEKIMHISGANFQFGKLRGTGSYYFSRYAHVWGWASWRRAWKYYDVNMCNFSQFKTEKTIKNIFTDKSVQNRWLDILEKVYTEDIIFNTWDFQWSYALFCQNALAVSPNVNLISNIGFGSGTNTVNIKSKCAALQLKNMEAIKHPNALDVNLTADKIVFKNNYKLSYLDKLKRVLS